MKYKRRFKWAIESVSDSALMERWSTDNDEVYWDRLWFAKESHLVVLRVGGTFFVSRNEANTRKTDRGPYKTWIEAIAAAETIVALEGSST